MCYYLSHQGTNFASLSVVNSDRVGLGSADGGCCCVAFTMTSPLKLYHITDVFSITDDCYGRKSNQTWRKDRWITRRGCGKRYQHAVNVRVTTLCALMFRITMYYKVL